VATTKQGGGRREGGCLFAKALLMFCVVPKWRMWAHLAQKENDCLLTDCGGGRVERNICCCYVTGAHTRGGETALVWLCLNPYLHTSTVERIRYEYKTPKWSL
jgi:hypothetical protein